MNNHCKVSKRIFSNFEIKHNVSMKSRRRFLHLSSFSDSNSFMTFLIVTKPTLCNININSNDFGSF